MVGRPRALAGLEDLERAGARPRTRPGTAAAPGWRRSWRRRCRRSDRASASPPFEASLETAAVAPAGPTCRVRGPDRGSRPWCWPGGADSGWAGSSAPAGGAGSVLGAAGGRPVGVLFLDREVDLLPRLERRAFRGPWPCRCRGTSLRGAVVRRVAGSRREPGPTPAAVPPRRAAREGRAPVGAPTLPLPTCRPLRRPPGGAGGRAMGAGGAHREPLSCCGAAREPGARVRRRRLRGEAPLSLLAGRLRAPRARATTLGFTDTLARGPGESGWRARSGQPWLAAMRDQAQAEGRHDAEEGRRRCSAVRSRRPPPATLELGTSRGIACPSLEITCVGIDRAAPDGKVHRT